MCWLLPCNNLNQPQVHTSPHPDPLPLTPHPSHPLGCTEHLVEIPESTQQLHLTICFTRESICESRLLSQLISPGPSPAVSKFCLCLHLYSCPANRFLGTIFLDSIYIYNEKRNKKVILTLYCSLLSVQ